MIRTAAKLSANSYVRINSKSSVFTPKQHKPKHLTIPIWPDCYMPEDFNNVDEVVTLFNQILGEEPRPECVCYNNLLRVVEDMKKYSQVIVLFKKLSVLGYPVDTFTRDIVINSYCNLKEADLGLASLALFLKHGEPLNSHSIASLIKCFFLEANVAKAVHLCNKFITPRIFDDDGCDKGVALHEMAIFMVFYSMYNSLNFVDAGKVLEAVLEKNYEIDLFKYCAVVNRLCENRMVDEAMSLVSKMIERGLFPNFHTCNALINGLCSFSRWDEAYKLLRQMVQGYCLKGQFDRAGEILNLMADKGLEPQNDLVSYCTMITDYWRCKK